MPFAILYHPDVKTIDIPRIDTRMRERIRKAIETRLMTAPQEYGTPLRKTLAGYWKLRVGDYRVVFRIGKTTVHVLGIRHRKSVYEDVIKLDE
ncbi:MAG: hypothetical protein OHK0028_01880 [Deltaproteobacteria bacterium]